MPVNVAFEAHQTQQFVLATKARFIVLSCGRRWGKDHISPIRIMIESLSRVSPRKNKRYAYFNPVYTPQGRDSFTTFMELAESGKLIKKNGTTRVPPQRAMLINDDTIDFFSLERPENLRGGQYDGIVVNEAGLVSNLKEIWDGPLRAMLLDRRGWAIIQGTPKGRGTGFHELFQRGTMAARIADPNTEWKSFRFPSATNPFLAKDEIESLRKELPEDIFRQEFLAEFIDGGGTVFRGLTKMRDRSEGLKLADQGEACRVGIDIGRHTDWTVLVALSPDHRVIGFDRFNHLDWEIIYRRVMNFLMRFKGKAILDTSGVGDPLFEALTRAGVAVTQAKFTNERKTMWVQNLMSLIEDGTLKIPLPGLTMDPARDTTPLWDELESFGFEVLPSGRVRYEAPKGRHDDAVTALYLAASEVPPMFSAPMGQLGSGFFGPLTDQPGVGESMYEHFGG